MKLSTFLSLPPALATLAFAQAHPVQEYSEHLHLRPLPNQHLHADFNFTATTPVSAYESGHFRYFPRSLAQILQHTHTSELHLRFALGRWDEESWGSRPRHGRREGGTGVELWAWIEGGEEDVAERWSGLVNSLSGLFCASLNFIDETKTVRPVLSFDPEGTPAGKTEGSQLLHGMLPHEVVCTENLTPFLKMLPCKGKAGISSLLDGHKLFDASWQSMAIDVRPVCPDKRTSDEECVLEVQQTVSMALSIPRSMRDRHDPIPRPPPVDQINCDEGKPWNGHDTCYPKPVDGELGWTLSKIFGRPIKGACPLGANDDGWDVTLEVPGERTIIAAGAAEEAGEQNTMRRFKLERGTDFELTLPQERLNAPSSLPEPALYASRQITGYGQERGGMHTTIRNPHAHAQQIVYFESLPWFLQPYMHTLQIAGGTLNKMFYTPAVDRKRGTRLELLLDIPAFSTLELHYDFEKAILRYTEYPPDANRGFDVAPAVIRVLPANGSAGEDGQGEYLRTTSLLLPLPTPDFSMPYNVIILTSTVIALGFGSIFNLLVRRFVLLEEVPESPLKGLIIRVRERMRGLLGRSPRDAAVPVKGQRDGDADGAVSTKGVEKAGVNGDVGLRNRKT